jgi:hypothetical protein
MLPSHAGVDAAEATRLARCRYRVMPTTMLSIHASDDAAGFHGRDAMEMMNHAGDNAIDSC